MSTGGSKEEYYFKKNMKHGQGSLKVPKYDKVKVMREIASIFNESWPKIALTSLPRVISKVMDQYDTLKRQHYERIQQNGDKVVEIMISRFPLDFQVSFDMYYSQLHPKSNDYPSTDFKQSRMETILRYLRESRSAVQKAVARSNDDMINDTKDQATQTDADLEGTEIGIWRVEEFVQASFEKRRFICDLLEVCKGCLVKNCEGARSVTGDCPTAPYCVMCGVTHSNLLSCPRSAKASSTLLSNIETLALK